MSDSKRELQLSAEKKDEAEIILKFLEHVVKGEQEEVEEMLKADPSLAYKKGKVTDYSGRQFIGIGDDKEGISAFQYALWARDTDMWLEFLPKIKDSKMNGIESIDIDSVSEIAKQQLKAVEEIGVTYISPEPVSDEENDRIKKEDEEERKIIKKMLAAEKKEDPFFDRPNPMSIMLSYHSKSNLKTESHYNFQIIKALESYNAYISQVFEMKGNNWDNWVEDDWKKANTIWQCIVGGAQRLVPVHVANQYCRPDLFFKYENTFNVHDTKESLKGHRTLNFYYGGFWTESVWFPLDLNSRFRLGVDFAVLKSQGWGVPREEVGKPWPDVYADLRAMTDLYKVRQEDIKKLIEKLDEILLKKGARLG